jgi:hypothetical protein
MIVPLLGVWGFGKMSTATPMTQPISISAPALPAASPAPATPAPSGETKDAAKK